jgi:hypothetical protein
MPVIYPPNLAFLADSPLGQAYVVRQLLTGPVFTTSRIPYFAFFSEKDGYKFFTLLVTSYSLSQGLNSDDLSLLSHLYGPTRKVGWWE